MAKLLAQGEGDQPAKVYPELGVAVRETVLPLGKLFPLAETLPLPDAVALRVYVVGGVTLAVKVAVQVLFAVPILIVAVTAAVVGNVVPVVHPERLLS